MRQQVTVVVHLKLIGMVTHEIAAVVLGNPLLVLHENLHAKLFFLGIGIVLF
jgi:hypothetical protein